MGRGEMTPRHRARRAAQSGLLQRGWRLPLGAVKLVRPSRAALTALDAEWGPLRGQEDVAQGWEWASSVDSADLFCLRTQKENAPLAIWRSLTPRKQLGGELFYQLDNIETVPRGRGQGTGKFILALVAARTVELGGVGVLLACPPEREHWYMRADIGAEDASAVGWTWPTGLVGLWIPAEATRRLKELADALEEAEGR